MGVTKRQEVFLPTGNLFVQSDVSTPDLKEKVHAHGMWYQPSPHPRVTSRDKNFREKLITAYAVMSANATETPANVSQHLWTDRKNVHTLLIPHGEVEIPHSMLARGQVTLHFDDEIEELVAKVPNKRLQRKLNTLFHHAANENIGLRSDIVRLLYGLLYAENEVSHNTGDASATSGATQHNIHIDIDTIAAHRLKRSIWELEHIRKRSPTADPSTKALAEKLAMPVRRNGWTKESIAGAKADLFSMNEAVKKITLPAQPPSITQAELHKLADQPQKSWSTPNRIKKATISNRRLEVKELKGGFTTHKMENSLIHMKAGHEDVVKVIDEIHRRLMTGFYIDAETNRSKLGYNLNDAERAMHKLHRLNTGVSVSLSEHPENKYAEFYRSKGQIHLLSPKLRSKVHELLNTFDDASLSEMSRNEALNNLKHLYMQQFVDYFRFSERTIQLGSRLQERLNLLKENINGSSDERVRNSARLQGTAIQEIYDLCSQLVRGVVNTMTYKSQVKLSEENATCPENEDSLNSLAFELFGIEPETIRTGNWGGQLHTFNASPILSADSEDEIDLAWRKAFGEIKRMHRLRTTDDLDYS